MIMGKLQAGIIPVTPFQQNCTILFDADTKEGVIVDPGGDVDVIVQTIEENGIKLKEIWLTHGHLDHAGWKRGRLFRSASMYLRSATRRAMRRGM